jgi:predicted site-specific integrase-resolvase
MTVPSGSEWNAVGPLLSAEQMRERLGVSIAQFDELVAAGRVITLVERSGRCRFPGWQVARNGGLVSSTEPDGRSHAFK